MITKKETVDTQESGQTQKNGYGDTLSPSMAMQMLYGLTDRVCDACISMYASIDGCGDVVIPAIRPAKRRGAMRRYSVEDVTMLRDLLFTLNGCGRKTHTFGARETNLFNRMPFNLDGMANRYHEVRDLLHGRGYDLVFNNESECIYPELRTFILCKTSKSQGDKETTADVD